MQISEIPGSLAIVKLDERHYQLTDLSTPSIGLCLGIFPSDGAARSFAAKIGNIRAHRSNDRAARMTGMSTNPTAPGISSQGQANTTGLIH